MALTGITGSRRDVDRYVMRYACLHTPSLVIDAANAADPHALYPEFGPETFGQVFIQETELIYTFRDIIKRLPTTAKSLGVRCIAVTTTGRLFHYQDDQENVDIFRHVWEMLASLGKSYGVVVGVQDSPFHRELARRHCGGCIELDPGGSSP